MSVKLLKTNNERELMIKVDVTANDINLVKQINPKALTLVDKDKKVIFAVDVSTSNFADASVKGVVVPSTNPEQKISFKFPLNPAVSDTIIHAMGSTISTNLDKVVEQVKETLATVENNKLEVIE